MRLTVNDRTVKIWLSADDTYNWAHWVTEWPCSECSGHRLFAEFDRGDLVDFALDGSSDENMADHELRAIVADYLKTRPKTFPKTHPDYASLVTQWEGKE